MAIRRPSVSVEEAKRLARNRSADPSGLSAAVSPQKAPVLAAETPSPPVGGPSPDPSAVPIEPTTAVAAGPAAGPLRRESVARASAVPAAAAEPFSGPVFPEAEPAEPKTQVFLSAPLPAKGVSASFDALGRHYPPTKALQMILRRALDNYEIRLENGSYKRAPGSYPVDGPDRLAIIQTSRMLPVRLVETARAHFDPLGFESTRAFGRKLACAALAGFFEAERKAKG